MPFCVSCGEAMEDGWMACPKCGTAKGGQNQNVAAPQFAQQPIPVQVREPRSKGMAFLLNFLIPGAGHMYLENIDRGLPVAIISTVCALILIGLPIAFILYAALKIFINRNSYYNNTFNKWLAVPRINFTYFCIFFINKY